MDVAFTALPNSKRSSDKPTNSASQSYRAPEIHQTTLPSNNQHHHSIKNVTITPHNTTRSPQALNFKNKITITLGANLPFQFNTTNPRQTTSTTLETRRCRLVNSLFKRDRTRRAENSKSLFFLARIILASYGTIYARARYLHDIPKKLQFEVLVATS